MKLTDALAAALMWHLDVDPCEDVTWGMNDSPNELAAAILADPRFREALAAAVFAAIKEDMSQPGCGYIDFTWRPRSEGDDSDGGREARAWAEAIVAHLLPTAATTADQPAPPERDATHD